MARNVPRVKVDPPKMNEYLGLRKSTIIRVYTVTCRHEALPPNQDCLNHQIAG